ncbi:hypothetical protein GGQ72_004794 [Rhizobium rhizoryzae]|uniref:Uncharacterized protein n=1 Tax=Rhizobium rhizoryzae TaxID=451876 RepID=A0A7W6LKX2_9HYPH|nr:hypothetical protein [Rhizobium rhizoryzae]
MHEKIGPHHLERKATSMSGSPQLTRFCTIAKAAPSNTPCATGWHRLDGHI